MLHPDLCHNLKTVFFLACFAKQCRRAETWEEQSHLVVVVVVVLLEVVVVKNKNSSSSSSSGTHGTWQWQPAMAPINGTPPLYHGTQPWFPTMAPSNATLPWNCKSAKVRTQPWHHSNGRHPTMAPYNGTQQWHPAMAPHHGAQQWRPECHVQSAKVVRRPPLLLEVRTPIAKAIWGKTRWRNWIFIKVI